MSILESMMPNKSIAAALAAAIITMIPVTAIAQEARSFGLPDDVAFAERLWESLKDLRLVGSRAIIAQPY